MEENSRPQEAESRYFVRLAPFDSTDQTVLVELQSGGACALIGGEVRTNPNDENGREKLICALDREVIEELGISFDSHTQEKLVALQLSLFSQLSGGRFPLDATFWPGYGTELVLYAPLQLFPPNSFVATTSLEGSSYVWVPFNYGGDPKHHFKLQYQKRFGCNPGSTLNLFPNLIRSMEFLRDYHQFIVRCAINSPLRL